MLKIAFLFLTITNVHHENLWQQFFAGHEDQYSIVVHAKTTISKDSYFKPYQMPTKVQTTWANTMRAQIALLEQALTDPAVEKCIFISESTIPLVDFDTAYTCIMSHDKSIFYFQPNPHVNTNGDYAPNTTRDLAPLPPMNQFKNAQWVALNRKHAQLMVNDSYFIDLVTRYPHDQEHYPSTFLYNMGLMHEVDPHDTTYVEWHKKGTALPYLFTDLAQQDQLDALLMAQKQGYLFARKIAKECNTCPLTPYLKYLSKKKPNLDPLAFDPIDVAFKKLGIEP